MSTGTSSWTRKASNQAGGDFEMPEPGSYPARLIGMIDLGTTDNDYKGKVTKRQKLLLCWELVGECDSKGKTFVVQQDYTFSLIGDKSNLRKLIEGWEGKALADGADYDFMALMGRECLISISEGVSGGGKKYVEVNAVGKLPKGMVCPKGQKEPFAWNFDLAQSGRDPELPDWVLPLYGRKVADDIKKSDEWASLSPF